MYFIRFLPPGNAQSDQQASDQQANDPKDPVKSVPPMRQKSRNFQAAKSTVFPKSVSISELLNAGRLIKPKDKTKLELESFDVTTMKDHSNLK